MSNTLSRFTERNYRPEWNLRSRLIYKLLKIAEIILMKSVILNN